MDEPTFLMKLAFLVCHRLSELDSPQRNMFCDGLIVHVERLEADPPRLEGRAFLSGIDREEDWGFVLLPDPDAIEGGRVNWQKLADAIEGTEWLRVDCDARSLEINLRADRVGGGNET